MAGVGVLGGHFAGYFFLGVDLLVVSMLVTFLLMCLSVLALPRRNPNLQGAVAVPWPRWVQEAGAALGVLFLAGFLVAHVAKDMAAPGRPLYLRSTPVWVIVMALASVLYWSAARRLRRQGIDVRARFAALPPE